MKLTQLPNDLLYRICEEFEIAPPRYKYHVRAPLAFENTPAASTYLALYHLTFTCRKLSKPSHEVLYKSVTPRSLQWVVTPACLLKRKKTQQSQDNLLNVHLLYLNLNRLPTWSGEVLAYTANLRRLGVYVIDMDDPGIETLCKAVSDLRKLESLHLYFNLAGSPSEAAYTHVSNLISSIANLRYLSTNFMQHLLQLGGESKPPILHELEIVAQPLDYGLPAVSSVLSAIDVRELTVLALKRWRLTAVAFLDVQLDRLHTLRLENMIAWSMLNEASLSRLRQLKEVVLSTTHTRVLQACLRALPLQIEKIEVVDADLSNTVAAVVVMSNLVSRRGSRLRLVAFTRPSMWIIGSDAFARLRSLQPDFNLAWSILKAKKVRVLPLELQRTIEAAIDHGRDLFEDTV